jgi:hypothetical protein
MRTTVTSFRKGDRVQTVVDNANDIGYPAGKVFTVFRGGTIGPGYSILVYQAGNSGSTFIISTQNLKLALITIPELEKELNELLDQREVILSKIKFMRELELDEFDETQYKVYRALEVLDSTKSKVQKAKVIADLINS